VHGDDEVGRWNAQEGIKSVRERWGGAAGESVQVGIKRKGQEWTEEMETRCGRERVESSRNEMR
jgi:hypothetical protein